METITSKIQTMYTSDGTEVEFSKREMLKGTRYIFSNEDWCDTNEVDELREAEVHFEDSDREWAVGYKIFFNGIYISTHKSFAGLAARLDKLKERWTLKLDRVIYLMIFIVLASCTSPEVKEAGEQRIKLNAIEEHGASTYAILEVDGVEYLVSRGGIYPLVKNEPCK